MTLQILDKRNKPDKRQVNKIQISLEENGIHEMLNVAKKFIGKYAIKKDQLAPITLVDGGLGNGEKDQEGKIRIAVQNEQDFIKTLQEQLSQNEVEVTKDQAREIGYAIIATTIGHEKIHDLFDSKPGSLFWKDLQEISGAADPNGERATIIDEGITYALQNIFAPEIEPIGSLAPLPKDNDNPEVKARKTLGIKLKSKVQEYLDQSKSIDTEFLAFTLQKLQNIVRTG